MRSSASHSSRFALAALVGALVATLLLLLAVDAQPLTPMMTSTTTRATTPSPSSSSAACPYISYTQALRPVTGTAAWIANDLPQYKLAFVNHSPQRALSQLDVQYRVNDGALVNVRLIGEHVQAQQAHEQRYSLGTAPPFILRAGDRVEYRFTYKPVDAPGLTCETPMFHVSGRELAAISSQSAGNMATPRTMPVAAAPMLASIAPVEGRADMHAAAPTVQASANLPSEMRAAAPTHITSAAATAATASHAQAQATTTPAPPPVHLEETAIERNADVCPLLPFTQQIHRTPSSDPRHPFRYTLRFENLSPSLSLTFLDAHVQINDGSVSNFRLFSDPSLSNKANQARALEGLPLDANDTLLYAFTYGVGTRACNTPTYKYQVE